MAAGVVAVAKEGQFGQPRAVGAPAGLAINSQKIG